MTQSYGAGNFRQRLIWQSQIQTLDSLNQNTQSWQTNFTVWGSVEPLTGRELWSAQQVKATSTHKIIIRGGTRNVLVSDRFLFGSSLRIFNIDSVIRADEQNAYLIIMATEAKIPAQVTVPTYTPPDYFPTSFFAN